MRKLFTNSPQVGEQYLYKLWENTVVLPSVVFATSGLGTNAGLMRSLFERSTQVYTRCFLETNRANALFIHTIHRPNKEYYKGD